MTLPTRIERKIERVTESGCWVWMGCCNSKGYGHCKGGRSILAHRVVYEMLAGEIPDGLVLDHLCRVTSCVNPSHLEPVTEAENSNRRVGAKTHCPSGHKYDSSNTYFDPCANSRRCRMCINQAKRLRRNPNGKAERTHCERGHEYTADNTRTKKNGSRVCRTCHRDRERLARARRNP